nr:PREDICTED: protein FAM78B [Struthio camelus australis]
MGLLQVCDGLGMWLPWPGGESLFGDADGFQRLNCYPFVCALFPCSKAIILLCECSPAAVCLLVLPLQALAERCCCRFPDNLAFLFPFARSSWELPDLREGRVKAISDSDGVSYPWYGNTTETVTLVGPTNKISRFSVSMNDNFYPSVTWAVPVSNSNVPLLTRIKRDQSFTTWLVAMNTTTKEKIILQTIKWRMRVDIEVDPMQLLGQRARLVGRTQQEQPRILSRMEPIPPNALVKPNANDAQVLMWRPKRGQPIVVIPPK